MAEDKLGVIFFRSQPYLKEDDKPSERDYPLIMMAPGISSVALINIPLGQEDDSITIGMTSYEDVSYPSARVTFSYSNGLGELSVDDERHRSLPPKYIQAETVNQIVIRKPKMRHGMRASRFHIWMGTPTVVKDIYDFGEYLEPNDIPVTNDYSSLAIKGSLLKLNQQDMKDLKTKYNGGKDFKEEIQELAKLKCLKNYTSEDWMIKRRESKRHIKRQISQTKHELERMEYITATVNEYMLKIVKQKEIEEKANRQNLIKLSKWKNLQTNGERITRFIDIGRRILTYGWVLEAGRQVLHDDIFVFIPILPASNIGWMVYIIMAGLNVQTIMPTKYDRWNTNFCPLQGGEEDEDKYQDK